MTIRLGRFTISIGAAVPAPAPPARAIPSHDATRLSDEAFCRAWGALEADSATFLAFKQLVARELVATIGDAAVPALVDTPARHAQIQGALIALLNLAATLDQVRLEPHRWTDQACTSQRKTR